MFCEIQYQYKIQNQMFCINICNDDISYNFYLLKKKKKKNTTEKKLFNLHRNKL